MCAAASGNGEHEESNASERSLPSDMGVLLDRMSEMLRGSLGAPIDGASLRGVSGHADRPERGEAGTTSPWNIVVSTIIYVHEAMCSHYCIYDRYHLVTVAYFSQTKFVSKCPIVWHMSYFSYSVHSVENISDNKLFINANDKYKGSHTIYVIN